MGLRKCQGIALGVAFGLLTTGISTLDGQSFPPAGPGSDFDGPMPTRLDQPAAAPLVADVQVIGRETVPLNRIQARLKTRAGRYYDADLVQADVQELMAMKSFQDVRSYTQETPEGIVVTFEVIERPMVREVQFFGNRAISDKALSKQIGIAVGDSLDPFAVRLARQRLEEFYRSKGFPRTEVEVLEGLDPAHRNVTFLIHEDQKRKIWKTEFIGNTIAPDGRLRTFVKTKPGMFKPFYVGKVDEDEIENDVKRITAYYRALGFFNARVGRELDYGEDGEYLTLRFIIDEGPRYEVRNVSIAGQERFESEELMGLLELKSGDPFNADKMQRDINALKDLYGSHGHIFADVAADPLFLESPGQLDLVYQIEEGDIYRVRHINVHIVGEYGITRRRVVINRISLAPGDIIDIRKIRDSERRLRASGLFAAEPGQGIPPRLELTPVAEDESARLARELAATRGVSTVRGQSPPNTERWIDLDILIR